MLAHGSFYNGLPNGEVELYQAGGVRYIGGCENGKKSGSGREYALIDNKCARLIYSGGFYPFQTLEEYWAWWSRHIWVNRYMNAPKPVYNDLLALVRDKDYFVLTTNVDHCFQKAGFDKRRMFYTQGDYGLFQCSNPCHSDTYDNEVIVRKMVEAQGYTITDNNDLIIEKGPMQFILA